MTGDDEAELRTLHALRVMGHGPTGRVAGRTGESEHVEHERLLDAQALGLVSRTTFAGESTWSLTEAGRRRGEQLLADQVREAGAGEVVAAALAAFERTNAEVVAACTAYQLGTLGLDAGAGAAATIVRLRPPALELAEIERVLVTALPRFDGYTVRFATALDRSLQDPAWIAGIDRDSCHQVWFELHEDLLSTLGRRRAGDR